MTIESIKGESNETNPVLGFVSGRGIRGYDTSSFSFAVSPRNPYRSFNLSGVNYGSMRWERTQRQKQSRGSFNKWPVGILEHAQVVQ